MITEMTVRTQLYIIFIADVPGWCRWIHIFGISTNDARDLSFQLSILIKLWNRITTNIISGLFCITCDILISNNTCTCISHEIRSDYNQKSEQTTKGKPFEQQIFYFYFSFTNRHNDLVSLFSFSSLNQIKTFHIAFRVLFFVLFSYVGAAKDEKEKCARANVCAHVQSPQKFINS